MLVPRTRRFAALAAAWLFVAVFPGNLNMVRLCGASPGRMRIAALARLPLADSDDHHRAQGQAQQLVESVHGPRPSRGRASR